MFLFIDEMYKPCIYSVFLLAKKEHKFSWLVLDLYISTEDMVRSCLQS